MGLSSEQKRAHARDLCVTVFGLDPERAEFEAQDAKREKLAYARARVSLLGTGEHMSEVDAALDSVEKLRALLRECETTLAMWSDVAPAESLRADIRKALGTGH